MSINSTPRSKDSENFKKGMNTFYLFLNYFNITLINNVNCISLFIYCI